MQIACHPRRSRAAVKRLALGLLLLLALAATAKAGTEWVRWTGSQTERAQLQALRERALDAGVSVVRTQSRSDTLRRGIESADSALARSLAGVERYARYQPLSPGLYARYRRELARYNAGVELRNRQVERWRAVRRENQGAVARYNAVADSIRSIAEAIGEPYYPVPAPIEAAAERGLIRLADP